ncbi:MAG: nitroreductase [Gammaproteobacteria bacterium]|nr:nitroreductase [Gammaproteobacteria bacterium]
MNKMIETLLSRQSHNKLTEPAPTDEQLDILFSAALRAPDHALLKPWRFRVYKGESLKVLGEFFVQASLADSNDLSEEKQDKIRNKPLRAPMVIIASVSLTEHPKVPEIEQYLSTGASVQNILMAAHFQNIGAIWRTGSLAFNPHLHRLLEMPENEKIVGFIYLGQEEGERRKLKSVDVKDFVIRA